MSWSDIPFWSQKEPLFIRVSMNVIEQGKKKPTRSWERKKLLKNFLCDNIWSENFLLHQNLFYKENANFIYSIITLFSKIGYYLTRLSRALTLTSLYSKNICLFKFWWKVCKIKVEKKVRPIKSSLVSGNRLGEKNFYYSEYIFLISKNKQAKKSKNTKKQKKLKKKTEYPRKID